MDDKPTSGLLANEPGRHGEDGKWLKYFMFVVLCIAILVGTPYLIVWAVRKWS